jgi:MFS family permease
MHAFSAALLPPVPYDSAAMKRWARTTFGTLSDGPFRILWFGTFLSFLGFSMSGAAQNVVAYDLAGNNRAVGTVMFFQGIAMLVLSPLGGAFADRTSRRALLLFCQVSSGVIYFGVGVLLAFDVMSIPVLAFSALLVGTVFALIRPARGAMIGDLVGPGQRGNAVAITELGINITRVAGPFLAGWLLAVEGIGATGTYFFMAAVFVVVVGALSRLPATHPPPPEQRRPFLGEVAGGVKYVWTMPGLRWAIGGMIGVTMLGWPYLVVLPRFTDEVLLRGTATYGAMLGVAAAGGLAASFIIAGLSTSPRASLYLLVSACFFSAGLAIIATSPGVTVAFVGMFVIGAGANGFMTLNTALAFEYAEPAYFGRVISFSMMALSANGLVGLPLGIFADFAGERAALLALSLSLAVWTAVLAIWRLRLSAPAASRAISGTKPRPDA